MRKEFSSRVKEAAFKRAAGKCENCSAPLTIGRFRYDHTIPDDLGGEPVLENCKVLCTGCDNEKTYKRDIPTIAKGRRIRRREMGIKKRSTFACSRQSKWKKKISGEVVPR